MLITRSTMLILILWIGIQAPVTAQVTEADSVWTRQVLDSITLLGRRAQLDLAIGQMDQALPLFKARNAWFGLIEGLAAKGGYLRRKGDFATAKQVLDSALSLSDQYLEPLHPSRGSAENELGIYHAIGTKEYPLAAAHFQKALDIGIARYGPEDRYVARFYNNLGNIYQNMGDIEKAIEFKQKFLSIGRKSFGEQSPYLAPGYNNLGHGFLRVGDLREAIRMFRRAVSLRINHQDFGPEHPAIGLYYYNLSETYYFLKEPDSARKYAFLSLAIRNKNQEKTRIPDNFYLLSRISMASGNVEKALDFNRRSMDMYRDMFGPDHLNVALMYDLKRELLEEAGRHEEALESAFRGREIKAMQDESALLARNFWRDVARLQLKMGNSGRALAAAREPVRPCQ